MSEKGGNYKTPLFKHRRFLLTDQSANENFAFLFDVLVEFKVVKCERRRRAQICLDHSFPYPCVLMEYQQLHACYAQAGLSYTVQTTALSAGVAPQIVWPTDLVWSSLFVNPWLRTPMYCCHSDVIISAYLYLECGNLCVRTE